jgi:hypothetical protein
MKRRAFLGTLGAAAVYAQEAAQPRTPDPNAIFVCPMDPDVRQHDPGTCPRCGMKLAAGLPEPSEYLLDLDVTPRPIRVGQTAELAFTVHDPWKHRSVTKFQVVHEKLFHMFLVSQDLEFFLHDHPVFHPDGSFHYANFVPPKAGMYRVLADFYPDASTPQLIAKTLIVPGAAPAPAVWEPSYTPKQSKNLRVEMRTVPEKPIAGQATQLHFKLTPGDRFEQYLGAWGHMLAASEDLIDLIHTHPFISEPEAQGGPEIQFTLVFPRPNLNYRLWVQFQRAGQVNTARFDVAVHDLR